MISYKEANPVSMLYGSAMDVGQIMENEKIMQDAYELGKQLVAE
jgi:hypothetical protein